MGFQGGDEGEEFGVAVAVAGSGGVWRLLRDVQDAVPEDPEQALCRGHVLGGLVVERREVLLSERLAPLFARLLGRPEGALVRGCGLGGADRAPVVGRAVGGVDGGSEGGDGRGEGDFVVHIRFDGDVGAVVGGGREPIASGGDGGDLVREDGRAGDDGRDGKRLRGLPWVRVRVVVGVGGGGGEVG